MAPLAVILDEYRAEEMIRMLAIFEEIAHSLSGGPEKALQGLHNACWYIDTYTQANNTF